MPVKYGGSLLEGGPAGRNANDPPDTSTNDLVSLEPKLPNLKFVLICPRWAAACRLEKSGHAGAYGPTSIQLENINA